MKWEKWDPRVTWAKQWHLIIKDKVSVVTLIDGGVKVVTIV